MTSEGPASSPVIRPATDEDLWQIEALLRPFIENNKLLPRTLKELQDLLSNGFVAELEGTILGFATLEIYSRKLAEVRSLAVSRPWQGRGIGKQLVHACLQRARQLDILEVMVITSSEEFFKSCGFDFTLPGEKKALFYQARHESSGDH